MVGALILMERVSRRPVFEQPRPTPDPPAVKPTPTLDEAALAIAEFGPPETLSGLTGGRILRERITVTGQSLLTESLLLVADRDLVVEGEIRCPEAMPAGAPRIDITLVSRRGTIIVQREAIVGSGRSAERESGGFILLRAPNVIVNGTILGLSGGAGTDAIVSAQGDAIALGTHGGWGGDVHFVAENSITLVSGCLVTSGSGGAGGDAIANSEQGFAFAQAGSAAPAGHIVLRGAGPQTKVAILAEARLFSGGAHGGIGPISAAGGAAIARTAHSNGKGASGNAEALGGHGGGGGTVAFLSCTVQNSADMCAGNGTAGGTAYATGGRASGVSARAGGDATAVGGNGGAGGSAPIYQAEGEPEDIPGTGRPGEPGDGGAARATPGGPSSDGGKSWSGRASAQSGALGGDQRPPASVVERSPANSPAAESGQWPEPVVKEALTVEVVRSPDPATPIRYALFDFDGTLSLIREGWQNVMVPYFVAEIAACPHAEPISAIESAVREFVARLTGKQTIYQCFQLAEEVRQRGGTPLEPLEYKHEYLRRLWERIAGRVEALNSGVATPEEHLVRGSRQFLEALRDRGVTLYLASGTDLDYVLGEARALQLEEFFGERIYGALDEYQNFSKQMIIDRILETHNLHGPELLLVGDGYVEIENGKGVGGITLGVASDEAHPGELDEWKRERLLQAGADAIVRDFADLPGLMMYLFPV